MGVEQRRGKKTISPRKENDDDNALLDREEKNDDGKNAEEEKEGKLLERKTTTTTIEITRELMPPTLSPPNNNENKTSSSREGLVTNCNNYEQSPYALLKQYNRDTSFLSHLVNHVSQKNKRSALWWAARNGLEGLCFKLLNLMVPKSPDYMDSGFGNLQDFC